MDPATGADQVIEGAFAYYSGEFISQKEKNSLLFLFLAINFHLCDTQSWKVSDDLGRFATLTTTPSSVR